MLGRDGVQRRVQLGPRDGVGDASCPQLLVLVAHELALLPAKGVHGAVADDPHDPAGEGGVAPVGLQEPEGSDERVLRDVLGGRAVAHEVPGEPEDVRLIEADDVLERAEVALTGAWRILGSGSCTRLPSADRARQA